MKNIENGSKINKYSNKLKLDISSIPLLSFFTGAGFLDLGFYEAGFKNIVWRNEYNSNFVKGFEYGMLSHTGAEHKITNTESILDILPEEIIDEAFHKTGKPDVFGIIGGTPCPDFATGGKNKGEEGEYGKLSQVYVDNIVKLQPTFFLMENVVGLSRTLKHKPFLSKLILQLQQHYSISHKVLNALNFGAPQFRERIFLVGVHKNWIKKQFDVEIPAEDESWFPWEKEKYPNARTAYKWTHSTPFGENPEMPSEIPSELMVGNYICNLQETSKLPNGEDAFRPRSDKFTKIKEGDSSGKSFKRLHRWRYSPAAAYGNNEVHLHPTEPRRLTVREVMRIQTVPDTYALPEDLTLTHKFKMVGNGVPVLLAKSLAASFINLFNDGLVEDGLVERKLPYIN